MRFDADGGTTTLGNDGDNAGGLVPASSFFYARPVTEKLSIGFSFASVVGLGLDYGDDWVGRYFVKEASLLTAAAVPSFGYRIRKKRRSVE